MSEPVVQRQAVPDPQEALREQIARAVDAIDAPAQLIDIDWDLGEAGLSELAPYVIADAVLPVVQAHTQALREELLDIIAEQEREKDDLRDRLSKKAIALAALRDAVSRLADDMEAEVNDRERSAHDEYGAALPHHVIAGLAPTANYARRLRSLLGDKENN